MNEMPQAGTDETSARAARPVKSCTPSPNRHSIRLAGPWERSAFIPTLRSATNRPIGAERVTLPCVCQPDSAAEPLPAIYLSRRFHRPSGDPEGCRVHICLMTDGPLPSILLNGASVAADTTHVTGSPALWRTEFPIGPWLQTFNLLVVPLVEPPAALQARTLLSASLEIHE